MYVAKFMVSYLVRFYLFKIILPLYQNHTPTLPKSHSDFHKITGWFAQHHWLIFTESHSDFAKIALRLYQNHTPIFTKPLADFHNITGWFWQNHTPTLPKSRSDFTKIADWFSQNHWLIFAKTRVDFWSPRLLLYCTPFQNRALAHCASCLSEGFSSFVTSLSGSAHCLCPFLWKKT